MAARLPNAGTVYDYFVDPETRDFKTWEEMTPKFVYDRNKPYSDILVR